MRRSVGWLVCWKKKPFHPAVGRAACASSLLGAGLGVGVQILFNLVVEHLERQRGVQGGV